MSKILIKGIFILAFVIAFVQSSFVLAQKKAPQEQVVADLKNEWLYFSPSYKSFVPYVQGTPFSGVNTGFALNMTIYKGKDLVCCVQPGTSLFINQKVIAHFEVAECKRFCVDSLSQIYGKENTFFTIYNPELKIGELSTFIASKPKDVMELKTAGINPININTRSLTPFSNFFTFGWVFIIGAYGILNRMYPKAIRNYFDITKAFAIRVREDSYYKTKLMSRMNISFLIAHSLLFSFIALIIFQFIGNYPSGLEFLSITNLTQSILVWGAFSMVILSTYIGKYYLIGLVASIFQLRDFKSVHFYDFIRITIIFSVLMYAIISVFHLGFNWHEPVHYKVLIYAIVFADMVRCLWIYFKLSKASSFRNLHLFSYLCTTEIIPLIVGLKILVF